MPLVVWQLRYNTIEPCQRVFERFRTYHKTGKKCRGEAWDDCNEQCNAEYGAISKPTPGSIKEFADNLNIYRHNEQQLLDMCGVKPQQESKPMKLQETMDFLVNAFKVTYGSDTTSIAAASQVSALADGHKGSKFQDKLSGSAHMFQGKGSFPELQVYVKDTLKRKDGLFSHEQATGAPAEESDDDGGESDNDSEEEEDDVPLAQFIKIRSSKWVQKHKPRPNETIEAYHARITFILRSGMKGDSSAAATPKEPDPTTLQATTAAHEAMLKSQGVAVAKPSKLLEEKGSGSSKQYLVRFVKPAGCERPPDKWMPRNQLSNADKLIDAFKKEAALAEGNAFEVEYIYNKRTTEAGAVEYLVKWVGYKKNKDYWEPASNLAGAEEEVKRYNEHGPPKAKKKRKQTSSHSDGDDDY